MLQKKLFLLDGMALVYRAYFAFSQNPRVTSYGFNTSAIFGYTNTVLDIIKKEKPTHIGVAFDTAAPTARHEEYESYKAHRQEQPEDITKSLPYIMDITNALNIPILTLDGYEADDIIGTLSKKAAKKGFTVYMVTPDKDFAQLVEPNIFIYKPSRMGNDIEIMGVPEVLKKWEVERVEQVIDILGLWGDAVDNIPGIPGIGEKTAKALMQKYGSIENLLANLHELKGKQKENIEKNKEQALLSKRLATIDTNVPIDFDEKSLELEPANKEAVEKLFAELEFKTMAKRLFGEDEAINSASTTSTGHATTPAFDLFNQGALAKPAMQEEASTSFLQNIQTVPHHYALVQTTDEINNLVHLLLQQSEICFDTETSALESTVADIVGLSFSFKQHEAWYIPLSAKHSEAVATLELFKPVFENEQIKKIGQNIKYDLNVLKRYGIAVKGKLFDTMLAHYLIEPDLRHNMDYLSSIYLKYQPVSIETLIGKKGKNQLSMRAVPLEKIKEYAAEDADITWQLKQKLQVELEKNNLQKLFEEVELPLIHVLSDMELEGIKIDDAFLKDYAKVLQQDILQLEQTIYNLAGMQFNIASPKQLGEVLFDYLKLDPKAKKTKTGQYQTGEEVLLKLSEHEIVGHILAVRELQKLKSTYVDALPELINPLTGRVHTTFNQAVAATGRLSSTNPNLQNIPVKTDRGKEVRKAFIPRNNDYFILSADYSQIELRIIASLANETAMIEAFKQNLDIHAATAARVYNKDITEVTATERRNAKAVNFGIIYGQSAFGLSKSLGIPRNEAARIIEEYFKQYPGIKQYMESTINFAKEHGYVQTILGRKRYLKDINSANLTVRGFAERNAINAPIQGSAADMIKVAMINIHKQMQQHPIIKKSKMVLQVHDELLFDAHKDELQELKQLVIGEMERALPLSVPVKVEVGVGNNWLEAH
jgi:DNA polymerase-1